MRVGWDRLILVAAITSQWKVHGTAALATTSNTDIQIEKRQDALTSSFQSALWIWTSEAAPPNAPPESRAFRRTYISPTGKSATFADILMTVDDRYSLYVNGNLAGSSPDIGGVYVWRTSQRYHVSLGSGSNVFAVLGTNLPGVGTGGDNPAGLLIAIQVTHSDSSTNIFTSDNNWRATKIIPTNFAAPSLDDSSWQPANSLGQYGVAPWNSEVTLPTVVNTPNLPSPTPSPTSSPTPSNSQGAGSKSKPSIVGPIVGGVIGGIAVISLLALIFLFRKRLSTRRSSQTGITSTELSPDLSSVQPFILMSPGEDRLRSLSSGTGLHKPALSSDLGSSSMSNHQLLPGVGQERYQDHGTGSVVYGSGPSVNTEVSSNRMQRLQDLMSELDRELMERGEGSPYVSELRGRIAELAREEQGNRIAVPPPYK